MITLEKAGEVLGLSPRQVYRRVATVRPLLEPYLRKGANGALLLDASAIEILRRAEELRRSGVTVAEAVAAVAQELKGDGGGEPGRGAGEPSEASAWERLFQEKDARIAQLEREVEFLRRRVEELLPLALPAPRRSWWARVLGWR